MSAVWLSDSQLGPTPLPGGVSEAGNTIEQLDPKS